MVPQQAQAEKLTLLVAENNSGYFGVYLNKPGQPKPYQARVWRGGKDVHLGICSPPPRRRRCASRVTNGTKLRGAGFRRLQQRSKRERREGG